MTREAGREAPAAGSGAGASAHSNAVRAQARELGFGLVGIATPEPTDHLTFYRRWLAEGRHGEMTYLARPDAVARRGDLGATLPGVRSVIVVGHEYYQEDPPGVPEDPSRGVIARYARGRDYHKVVKKKLAALGRWIEEVGGGGGRGGPDVRPVRWRAYVDTGPILERDLARRAGLGWFGKNTMLINPRKGSYFFVGVLLTDLELDPDAPFEADHCGSCRACLDACPTGALLGPDASGAPVMDATRCISYLTIEHRGETPAELRPLMRNRINGCDICQEVCPWNQRFAKAAAEPEYAARGPGAVGMAFDEDEESVPGSVSHPGTDGPRLADLVRMDEAAWDAFTRGSAIRRAGYSGLRRNVAVALGNWLAGLDEPDPEAMGALSAALSDEDQVVALSAAWALRQLASLRGWTSPRDRPSLPP